MRYTNYEYADGHGNRGYGFDRAGSYGDTYYGQGANYKYPDSRPSYAGVSDELEQRYGHLRSLHQDQDESQCAGGDLGFHHYELARRHGDAIETILRALREIMIKIENHDNYVRTMVENVKTKLHEHG